MSELCTLAWRDLQPNQDGGQITVLEKGSKTRSVQLPASVWQLVSGLRSEDAGPDNPVFASRKGKGFLQPNAVLRIVGAAAERGRHRGSRVAHWLRHAHASHALDRGPPSTSSRAPSATPASPPPAATSTPAPPTAPAATCRFDPPRLPNVREATGTENRHHRSAQAGFG